MALLTVSHLSKAYPGLPVLHDVSFDVAEGEIVCLLGPSGCGKTTLLRIVAGLEAPDQGQLRFAGEDLARVPVHRRGFGLMFQDFALFPHQNVFDNVAFGLRGRAGKARIAARVSEVLQLVRLEGYERRAVTELSGGEQQRVALARSLAPNPRLLMLDEPLGSLDRTLREQVMNELRSIIKQVSVTALYVTHDQSEAFAVADRIFVMRPDPLLGGQVDQAGAPQAVYHRPATAFVARFLGFQNLLAASVISRATAECVVGTALGPLHVSLAAGTPCVQAAAVTALVRPEAAEICPPSLSGENIIAGLVQSASFRGSHYLLRTLHAGDIELTWEMPASPALARLVADQPVTLRLDAAAIALLDR